MPEMTAHKVGDPSFLHACVVEPSYKLHLDLKTKPAKKTIIMDPSFTANTPVADPGERPRGEAQGACPPPTPAPQARPPLFSDQTEAQRAERIIFQDPSPPYLRVWMTRRPFCEGLDPLLHSITCSQSHAVTHNKEKVGSSSHAVVAL